MAESSALTIQPAGTPSELAPASFEIVPPSALTLITKAEIDMQITTAKQYPRVYSQVKQRMIQLATLDTETAESCFYVLNRQGKNIEGPSVRLAEIAASCFGNMRAGAQVIDNDGKTITARGVCHDLETNTLFSVDVKRRITNKEGRTYSEDMQVVTGNAACSIALRNAVFRTVPFALIKPVYEQAKQVAVGDIKTLAERRTKMLKTFAALGVNEQRVLAAIDKPGVEDIGLTELTTLIGLHSAVKDGDTTVEEAFPPVAQKAATKAAPAALPAKATPTPAAAAPATPAAKPAPSAPAANPTPEAAPAAAQPAAPVVATPATEPAKPAVAEAPAATENAPIADDDLEEALATRANEAGVALDELEAWAHANNMLGAGKSINTLTPPKMRKMVEGWEEVKTQILAKRPQ